MNERTKQPKLIVPCLFRGDGVWAQTATTRSAASSSGQRRWPSPPQSWHNRSSNTHDSWKWLCNPPPGTHSDMYKHTQKHEPLIQYTQSNAQTQFPWGIRLHGGVDLLPILLKKIFLLYLSYQQLILSWGSILNMGKQKGSQVYCYTSSVTLKQSFYWVIPNLSPLGLYYRTKNVPINLSQLFFGIQSFSLVALTDMCCPCLVSWQLTESPLQFECFLNSKARSSLHGL